MVWGKHSAYIERSDTRFREQIDRYFARLQVVDDVTEVVDDNVLKITVFDLGTAEFTILPFLESFQDTHKVAVGSTHWVDAAPADLFARVENGQSAGHLRGV